MTVLTRGCCASDTIKHTETSLIQQGPKIFAVDIRENRGKNFQNESKCRKRRSIHADRGCEMIGGRVTL
ncbi:hypothetical protein F2P81_010379 [Scophthalmus maximus]|uniref:Uncharacterized protein n=1 Tax=Scophthalmus maximus TaxID=52904 RepID=A0A6A4SXM5_SCOMX|nr:hypothetical protein F2P81_010379 [Scophthalmus maximus]